jgi:hypothetical protein
MIISLDGWWGSGKSVLRGLLDGHPEVFSSPIHEVVPISFMNEHDQNEWLSFKDTEYLRRLLAHPGRYFRIERFAQNGRFQIDFSSEQRVYVPFEFDFYGFDRALFQSLILAKKWTINGIVETVYRTFALFLNHNTPGDHFRHFATMGEPHSAYYDSFRSNYPNGKVIYVDRATENIIATRCGRRPIKEDYRSNSGYANELKKLVETGEVQRIEAMRSKLIDLQNRYPDSFRVVGFDDLVLNTAETMRELATFLGIEYRPILTEYSFFGKELTCNGLRYIGRELDRAEDLLSETELRVIRQSIANTSTAPKSVSEFLLSIVRVLMPGR